MDEELWSEIRRLCLREGLSQREVANRLRIDRGTVKRALESSTAPRRNARQRGSMLDRYKAQIKDLVLKYPDLSGVRIIEEIKKNGYRGSLTIVRDYLRQIRPSKKEAFLRIETDPGEFAQVDWANCGKIMVDGAMRKLSCFVMCLSYSRLLYLEFTLSQRIEDFIRCHINAFRYFGGITKKILYDNTKTVVLSRIGKTIQFNQGFQEFAGYYLFEIKLARIYRATDKGKVENNIHYIRVNFLAGREFVDFDDIKSQSAAWRDNVANVRIHGTTRERPVDRFQGEKYKLMSLPENPYTAEIPIPCRSSSDCRVKFDGNIYSVPSRHADKSLVIRATNEEVSIYNKTRLIATHKRSYGKGKVIEDPRHIKELLKKKRKAISSKIMDEFNNLGNEAGQYLKGLVTREVNLTREVAKILSLRHKYGTTEVLGAMVKAMGFQAFGASYIENIIISSRKRRGEPPVTEEIHIPEKFSDAEYKQPELSIYDMLIDEDNKNNGNKGNKGNRGNKEDDKNA